jgi:hypothetical protein
MRDLTLGAFSPAFAGAQHRCALSYLSVCSGELIPLSLLSLQARNTFALSHADR